MKINAKNGFDIRFIKNNTYALLVTFKDIEEDLRSAFFTVKENPEDTTPILQKHLGAGISKVDDRAYKKEKKYKVQLQAEDTTPLEADVQYLYDLQVTIGNVVKTVASGLFVVSPTITGDKVITTQEADIEATDELDTEFATVEATVGIEYENDPVANAKIGNMTALTTNAKQTVVQAVNEVKNGVDGVKTQVDGVETKVDGILGGTTAVPKAEEAQIANEADWADEADFASNDMDGNDIPTTYMKIADFTGEGRKVVNEAVSATYDGNGHIIHSNYARSTVGDLNNTEKGLYVVVGKVGTDYMTFLIAVYDVGQTSYSTSYTATYENTVYEYGVRYNGSTKKFESCGNNTVELVACWHISNII